MKKIYVMPHVEVINLNAQYILAGSPTGTEGLEGVIPGSGDKPGSFAKGHNSIWDEDDDF